MLHNKNIAYAFQEVAEMSISDKAVTETDQDELYKDRPFTDLVTENEGNYSYYLADESGEDYDIVEERADILVF